MAAIDLLNAFGRVFKSAVGLLPVQPIPVSRVALVGRRVLRHRVKQLRAVRQIKIKPPVVIVVEQRTAAAH